MRDKDSIALAEAYLTILEKTSEPQSKPCPCEMDKKCIKDDCSCKECKKQKKEEKD